MEEHILGQEPAEESEAWKSHDWTAEEVTFVAAFLRTGNMTRAYREAKNVTTPTPSHKVMGHRWLREPHIASYVAMCQAAMRKRLDVNKERILEELAKLGYANMSDFVILQRDGTPQFDLSGLDRDQMAAIQSMEIETYMMGKGSGEEGREVKRVKLTLAPKIGPLELLGKHHKMFTDVIESNSVADVAEEMRQARQARQRRRQEEDEDNGRAGGDGDGDERAERQDEGDATEGGVDPD